MDERALRLAENERVFREVNEQIERAAIEQADDEHVFEFLCECSNLDCTHRLRLTLAAYEHARSDPAVFIVAAGHHLPEIEDVIFQGEGYQLVRKYGEAARVAEGEGRRRPR